MAAHSEALRKVVRRNGNSIDGVGKGTTGFQRGGNCGGRLKGGLDELHRENQEKKAGNWREQWERRELGPQVHA